MKTKCVKCHREIESKFNPGDYCGVCTIGVQGMKADPHQVRLFNERRGDALEKIANTGYQWKRTKKADLIAIMDEVIDLARESLWRREQTGGVPSNDD